MTKQLFVLFLIFLSHLCAAADGTQLIRGRVLNASTQQPVAAATIFLQGPQTYSSVTDSLGEYSIQVLPGNYTLSVQHPAFRIQVKENISVFTGKQRVHDIELSEYKMELNAVATVDQGEEKTGVDQWNLQQFAAVFYDPARVLNSHAGLVNTDDQANNISVRGTTPNYMQWKIEGLEVVNPNHLENAGTLNDRPSLNGGGVSLISAQLLQSSGFQFAPFDPSGGNALSGIVDMKLRNGNNQRTERIIQASLLGTDVSFEGPFSKKSSASYLVNARYSTVGLLSAMGINFGNERINYKDLSLHVSLPHKKGSLKIFGMAGDSETISTTLSDSSEIRYQKDLQNIDYHSFTMIAGLSNVTSLSNTMFLKTVLAYSSKDVTRSAVPGTAWFITPVEEDAYRQEKFSSLNYISKRLNSAFRFKAGAYLNYFVNSVRSSVNDAQKVNASVHDPLIQPFIMLDGMLSPRFEMSAGVHSLFQERTGHLNILPSGMLKYRINTFQDLSFHYGAAAQLQPAYLYLGHEQNRNLRPTTSQAFSLRYSYKRGGFEIRPDLYYQLFDNIPVSLEHEFSAFNYFNEQVYFPLQQTGTARVYGMDLTLEKRRGGFYGILSSGLYQSEYTVGERTRDARFNTGYNLALTAGHELKLKKKANVLGIHARSVARNGFREPAVTGDHTYSRRLPFYSRVDFRISYTRNKQKSTVIWALDIQNLLNTQNVAYHYADMYSGKTETRYQLGLIPVLSYKILF